MKKTDSVKDSETVKLKLAAALKECMKKIPIEDITVKEISDQSGFSRQTFYRNFLDKYDLLNWYFDRLLNESFREMGSGETIYDGLVRKFTYIKKERVLFENAFRTDVQNSLRLHDFEKIDAFYRNLIREKTGSQADDRTGWMLEMYCQASVYMTVKWVLEGMQMPEEELAERMVEAMPEDLRVLFQKLNLLKKQVQ